MQIYSILCKCTTDLSLVKVSCQVQAFELERRKNERCLRYAMEISAENKYLRLPTAEAAGQNTLLTFLEEVS